MAIRFSTSFYTTLPGRTRSSAPRRTRFSTLRPSSSPAGDSYLDMWKKAMDRERRSEKFRRLTENPAPAKEEAKLDDGASGDSLAKKTESFNEMLRVPKEERDRVQRLQVIHRAAAAIAAARALIKEAPPPKPPAVVEWDSDGFGLRAAEDAGGRSSVTPGSERASSFPSQSRSSSPGPDFWSWMPPPDDNSTPQNTTSLKAATKSDPYPNPPNTLLEKVPELQVLPIPFESSLFSEKHHNPLPPFESTAEFETADTTTFTSGLSTASDENKLNVLFSTHAAEAAETLRKSDATSAHGVNPDGSKWWRETGTEQRPDGVTCRWTLTRGVSVDGAVEWEDKFWEAFDQFDYKELGSEKSGRDAVGNVWCEYWRESMWQELNSGLMHIEKTADKWGKNGNGDEWQEKWWEHYDASGQAEKWAHKWCSIDTNVPLEAGHAHVWHERWGEKFDGKGRSMKYTDKWAERWEGDGWSKWGDKWDDNFDSNGCGVKQGETWWQGKHGDRWNRTWGEQHNGSGWVHKFGRSSSGEHWDTHVQQDTWYETYPHYGFEHCFKNSVQLRAVRRLPKKL